MPALLLAVGVLAACGSAEGGGQEGGSGEGDAMRVSASMSVIQDLAEQVGGDRVDVSTIVPVGGSPETFQPSPQDAAGISESAVVLENGAGLDDWIEDLIESAGNEDQMVVELSEGLEPLGESHDHGDHGDEHGDEEHGDHEHGDEEHADEHGDEEHSDEHGDDHDHGEEGHSDEHGEEGHSDEHGDEHGDDHSDEHGGEHSHEGEEEHADEHGGEEYDHGDEHGDEEAGHEGHDHAAGNPHYWLDVENTKAYVETIRDTFVEADPDGAEEYEANTEEYLATLDELDEYIRSETESIPEENRKLVTFHEAFPYFAEAYGYEEVAVILRNPDAEPSSREVAETVTAIREENVPAVFTEPQFSQGPAETVADEAGVETYEIYADTLLDDSSADSYEAMMRTNMERLVEGLG